MTETKQQFPPQTVNTNQQSPTMAQQSPKSGKNPQGSPPLKSGGSGITDAMDFT